MAKVFVSYRHVVPDQDLAAELARFLEDHGFEVFVDTRIRVGHEWIEEIESQLRSSQHFVVLLSGESVRSDMVRWEVALAHKLRKARLLRVFPVRVAFAGELPYDLGAYLDPLHYASWSLNQAFESVCREILKAIQEPQALNEPEADEVQPPSPENLRLLADATELRGAPLPAADPRLETGAVGLDSPFYIRRAADARVASLVTRSGVTLLIKGPRQVGKTSLLARAQAQAQESGQRAVYFDFQLIDESRLESLKDLLLYFAHRIARELGTPVKPTEVWDDLMGAPESLTNFLEQVALGDSGMRLVLVLDEADRIFQYKFRNAFFAMLRAWHNRRAINPCWKRLNVLIGHSTEPALFIDDINQSPFNVGEVFRLSDFAAGEVEQLNEIHQRPLKTPAELTDLMRLVGGHPYLVRQSFYSLRCGLENLEALKAVAADDQGPFGDHLRRLLWALRNQERLRKTLKQAVRDGSCTDEIDFQRLRAAGILEGDGRESARMRCNLYRQYFSKHL